MNFKGSKIIIPLSEIEETCLDYMREPIPEGFILYESLPVAKIYYHPAMSTALIVSTVNFIPMDSFKATFEKVAAAIELHHLEQVIFDKRSLTIFHQPSMEWYYTFWKSRLYFNKGITKHGKILPKDDSFRKSVHQARSVILNNNKLPELQKMDISYYEDLQELLKKNHSL